ncbi:MAG: hypothetical protein ACI8T1_004664 [Verrucomicrobiales bacterium]
MARSCRFEEIPIADGISSPEFITKGEVDLVAFVTQTYGAIGDILFDASEEAASIIHKKDRPYLELRSTQVSLRLSRA